MCYHMSADAKWYETKPAELQVIGILLIIAVPLDDLKIGC